jgi:hypothetical protein
MQISVETVEKTNIRLRNVIANTDFVIYDGTYIFEEFPLHDFKSKVREDALAFVRDKDVWSQLIPSCSTSNELFTLFSFHFDACSDNSGFVGWLATHLKGKLGTGVFVTCGQNSKRGGIFDYWGCPAELGLQAIEEVRILINKNK